MVKFIFNIIKGNKKEYLITILTLSLIYSFCYIFLSLYDVVSSIQTGNADTDFAIDIINFFCISLGIIIIIIIISYFIENRLQEYAIFLMTGRKFNEVIKYVFVHFSIILTLACTIGVFLGIIFKNIMNIIYSANHINFYLSYPSFFLYLALFILSLTLIFFYNFSIFNRVEMYINNYLRNKINFSYKMPKKRKYRYLAFTFIGFLFVYNSFIGIKDVSVSSILMFIGSIIGVILIVKYLTLFIYYTFHESFILSNKKVMFIFNNFIELSSIIMKINIINCIIIPIVLISTLIMNIATLKLIMISYYFITLIMIFICYVFKLNSYCKGLTSKIDTLKALGYDIKDMYSISNMQIILFLVTVLMPIIIYSMSFMNILHQSNGVILMILVISYIAIYMIIGIYMFIKFHFTIKGAYSNVKYLNRS